MQRNRLRQFSSAFTQSHYCCALLVQGWFTQQQLQASRDQLKHKTVHAVTRSLTYDSQAEAVGPSCILGRG